jgi:hypothetical protein
MTAAFSWGRDGERGSALLTALLLVVLFGALAAAVTVATRTETLIAANFRQSRETLHAAEGAAALAIHALAAQPDWTLVLSGAVSSSFVDGASAGTRRLPGGDTIALCCGPGSVTDDVRQRAYGGGDWGADTPVWRLFAWGPATAWLGAGRIESALYIAVWVADDPHDGDGNPAVDSNRTIVVHAQAFAPAGGRRVIESLVRRPIVGATGAPSAGVSNVVWHEIRW